MAHDLTAADIKAIRDARGWTQAEFANGLGITPRAVQHWESGARKPRGTAAKLLALMAADNAQRKPR